MKTAHPFHLNKTLPSLCLATLLPLSSLAAAGADPANPPPPAASAANTNGFSTADTAEINLFLQQNFSKTNSAMVVGLLDEHGSQFFSTGKLDNGTDALAGPDTLFEIGSVTKTFTALLLVDMVDRGEMRLDDPVASYLPASVKVPSYHGTQITLLNLAAQDSGLPFNASGLDGDNWLTLYDAFNVEKMYSFLSGYTLTVEPGLKYQYSNVGLILLGNALERKTGRDFEGLVLERICRPLHMDSTVITLSPELKPRTAVGHYENGRRSPDYQLQALAPAGALHSTAADLLKYLAANLGLTPSPLTPLMAKMQVIRHRDSPDMGKTAMPWYDQTAYNPPGSEFLGHGGGSSGSTAFIGFDRLRRRAVVVLSNQRNIHCPMVGWRILQSAPLTGLDPATLQPIREIVGAGFSFDLEKPTGRILVTRVFPNTPAADAGMSAGLAIQKINGTATAGKSIADCLQLMRGPAGTRLQFDLIASDGSQTNSVELSKRKILL